MSFWFWHRNSERQLLREILCRIEQIERRLEPKVFLRVEPVHPFQINNDWDGNLFEGAFMASIQAGTSGEFLVSGTASDNSTVTLSNIQLTADDPAVTVEADPADTTGATFIVTVPASDKGTAINLSATADAKTSTSDSPTVVPAQLAVTIQPGTGPTQVTVTLAINQK